MYQIFMYMRLQAKKRKCYIHDHWINDGISAIVYCHVSNANDELYSIVKSCLWIWTDFKSKPDIHYLISHSDIHSKQSKLPTHWIESMNYKIRPHATMYKYYEDISVDLWDMCWINCISHAKVISFICVSSEWQEQYNFIQTNMSIIIHRHHEQKYK